LQYVIFPFQFAFLYSYYPSGRMEEISAALEERWKVTHKESSEKVFARNDEGFVQQSGPSFFQKAEAPKTVLRAKKE
jgi:zeaxanthin epoxidase